MKNNYRCTVLTLGAFCLSLVHASYAQDTRLSSGGRLGEVQANMDIRHYTLNLNVDISRKSIDGFTEIRLNLLQPSGSLLFQLVNAYRVKEVWVDQKNTVFQHTADSLRITTRTPLSAGSHTVRISYSGAPPVALNPPWQGGFTWTTDSTGNPWVAVNCQMEGGKIYFPCKDHPSDEPDEGTEMFITVPEGLVVAGPGLLQSVKKQGRTAAWHWKTGYTISNYCLVFNIGKYAVEKDTYTTVHGNRVPIEFYVLEEHKHKGREIVEMRARDARILEKYFGEYPWVKEKMGIAEVPNYGMEHQTLISYGGENFRYHHYPGFSFSDNLFHEFTHEWFANKVTNKDWAHFWIQEGITTYADALFFREMLGEKGYDSVMVAKKADIEGQVPVVQGETLTTLQAYNGDVYNKGAFLMHTLRHLMGDSLFFPALKALSENVKYPYTTFLVSDDVEKHFSTHAGKSLKPVFDFYLYKKETLDIHIRKLSPDTYAVYTENFPQPLAIDIRTSAGIQTQVMDNLDPDNLRKNIWTIKSTTLPEADPGNWYFKHVIYE